MKIKTISTAPGKKRTRKPGAGSKLTLSENALYAIALITFLKGNLKSPFPNLITAPDVKNR